MASSSEDALAGVDPLAERVFETPVRLMRVVWAWPDPDRSLVKAYTSRIVISNAFIWITLATAAYIFSGEYDSVVSILSSFVDVVAGFVVLFKIHCVFHYGDQLREMRAILQHSFKVIEDMLAPDEAREANLRCISRARKFCRWLMVLYAPLCASGVGINMLNMVQSRETRQLNIKAPAWITRCDWTYWPLFTCSMIMFTTFVFMSGGIDSLFLSLCMHMRCKCEILRKLFRHAYQKHGSPGEGREFEYWNNDGTDYGAAPTLSTARANTEVEEALKACARYHQTLIRIRDTMELVFTNVSLILMAYLLLGLGLPALRVLYDKSMDTTASVFLMLYTTWNFAQLLFYCWFADTVAFSSEEVSVAAYSALRPDVPAGPLGGLTGPAAATLNLMTLRAQRPLHLTAGHFVKLTLELYLDIMRRTQSIYSYLLKLG